LDDATLEPVLSKMKTHLIDKNVASDISQHLCDSVRSSLMGKKLSTFGSATTLVKENMETALKRILTPKTSVDILRDIEHAKAQSKPYSITFIGVNGVGKVKFNCLYTLNQTVLINIVNPYLSSQPI
jgi:signal recognition particle receptor subunit alpha